jgi:hypothetical protein
MSTPERQPHHQVPPPGDEAPVLTHRPPRPGRVDRVDGPGAEQAGESRRPPPAPRGDAESDPPDAEDLH